MTRNFGGGQREGATPAFADDRSVSRPDTGSPTPAPARTTVHVIIVNYNTAALTIAAVRSVLSQPPRTRAVHVHIVDNASPGDDSAVLTSALETHRWGDAVTLYLEAENHGFGRGNNLVLARLLDQPDGPRYAFLLNPDARLKTDAITQLADLMDQDPRIAVAGCGIDAAETDTPVTAAFRFPSLISEFASGASFGPISRLAWRWRVPLTPDQPAGPVDWVAGAAMMLRLEALRHVGPFDRRFFLYFEETELMHRLARRGWQTWYAPFARVGHLEGASTGVHTRADRPSRLPSYWYDSWRVYFLASGGPRHARFCALARLSGTWVHAATCALRRRQPSYPEHFSQDFFTHVVRPLWRPVSPP